MLQIGRTEEIGRQLPKCKLDLIARQEIKSHDVGRINKDDYSIHYRAANKQGNYSTDFIFSKSAGLLIFYFANIFCQGWPSNIADKLADGDTFDFIVVGSGSAGSPVAARLAQRGQDVLLLEAGGEPPESTAIPGMSSSNLMTNLDWQFATQLDYRMCRSLLDELCHKPRGKVLGGSSTINSMMYVRGNKADYDEWNTPSWTYEKMLPYFLRIESLANYDDLPPELKEYHNNDGPLKVSLLNASTIEWRDNFINAYQEIGLMHNPDINGPSQIGVTFIHATIFAGERQSTAKAYLVPNSENKHLNVAYNSFVTKVIIGLDNVAEGVRVSVEGNDEITIKARKEIILSAGTINTPQLLMLSGVGPESELQKHGIDVRVNNQHVGQHLSDHPMTPIVFTANTGTAIPTPENFTQVLLNEWLADRSGLLGTLFASDVVAFFDTALGSSVPDTQYMHSVLNRNYTTRATNLLKRLYKLNDEIISDIEELNENSEIVMVTLTLVRPKSRGSIHLASSDPYDHPLINANTLVEPEDYATYLRGIRLIEKLIATEVFLKNNVTLAIINSLRECNDLEIQSDAYWICYRNNLGDTSFHPVSTASIGRVVDERLRVYGVKRLRVADASVMPFVPRGNINAPTIAIGERAVDFIVEDNGLD